MTNKEYNEIRSNSYYYHIEYETAYSKGVIDIDTKLYLKKQKKIERVLKDATIIKFIERGKDYEGFNINNRIR